MKVITSAAAVASIFAVSACTSSGGGSGAPAVSGIIAPVGSVIPVSLSQELNLTVSDSRVGTVAYVTGIDNVNGQIEGYAGVRSGANVGNTVTGGGTAVYAGQYGYQVVDNVQRTSATIGGDRVTETGSILLTANFNQGTLTGNGAELDVNGTISGAQVGGTVTANYSQSTLLGGTVSGTVSGQLTGNIGDNGMIGAFHGTDSNTVLAGGVVAVR